MNPRERGRITVRVKRVLRRWAESGFDVHGECNLCGDCCHTIWMCEGHTSIDGPLDIPCEVCGEGYHTQVQRVTCPYLTQDETCGLYSPTEGLPYNCCRNFPRVKDILWHPRFYDELPDCDFHLVRKKLAFPRKILFVLALPFLAYFRLRRRLERGRAQPAASTFKDSNPTAPPDPRRPLEVSSSFEV